MRGHRWLGLGSPVRVCLDLSCEKDRELKAGLGLRWLSL